MNNTIDPSDSELARARERLAAEDVDAFDSRTQRGTRQPGALAALFSDLWRDTTTLVQQQTDLAKAEASEKLNQMALAIGAIAAAGAVVFAGFIILLMSAVNALAPHLPPQYAPWLAPLIVGLVIIVVGYIMFASGRKALEAQNLKPERSVESMRRTTAMVKEHVQ